MILITIIILIIISIIMTTVIISILILIIIITIIRISMVILCNNICSVKTAKRWNIFVAATPKVQSMSTDTMKVSAHRWRETRLNVRAVHLTQTFLYV